MNPLEHPLAWALGAAALLVLRWISVTSVRMPPQDAPTGPRDALAGAAGGEPEPQDWEGSHHGAEFAVECLDGASWTVSIDSGEAELSKPLELDARAARPELPPDARGTELKALLELGAAYVDVGRNADWVAAEFPLAKHRRVDRALAERVVDRLLRLRDLSR